MARSTGVGAPAPGAGETRTTGADQPVAPVVRRKRPAPTAPARTTGRKKAEAKKSEPKKAASKAATAKKSDAKKADAKKGRSTKGDSPSKKQAKQSKAAATASSSAGSTQGRFARLLVAPDTAGPRVRMGVLWFLVALAAATSGRSWTAALWAVAAGLAGYQIVGVWQRGDVEDGADPDAEVEGLATGGVFRLFAALGAAVMPVAASYSTGAAGLALIVVPLLAIVLHLVLGQRPGAAGPTVIGIVLPALAAISVVLAVRINLWAGLFVILAVSLYDAGSFLLGADAGGRWEGPVAGMLGALAVTFTMATFQSPPFDRTSAWVAGAVMAVTCPMGQWLASAFLPSATSRATALRRIDAYLIAGPAFVVCAWIASSG
ncbi:hypothetical protein BH10ACT3_BH10ACT3_19590 [soil metagenome]